MKILITGCTGFIGRRLATRLAEAGHSVIGSGRSPSAKLNELTCYVAGEVSSPVDCARMLSGCDAVVHCAGKAGEWGSYREFEHANVTSTRVLVSAAQQAGVRRFVNLSSPSLYLAYRDQLSLREEDVPSHFTGHYAATKYAAEQIVSMAHGTEFQTVSLRPRGVIGAGDANWFPRVIAMRKSGALVQPGAGNNLADFTSVENLLDAIELCLSAPFASMGRVYNVTNGKPERLWDVVEAVLVAVGLDGNRRQVPRSFALAVAHLNEWAHKVRGTLKEPALLPLKVGVAAYSMTLDISAVRRDLGYRPRVGTYEAIAEFADWWRLAAKDGASNF